MQLIEKNGVFAIADDSSLSFLVPGKFYTWEEENSPYFEYRLASTRGGKQAFWSCNEKGREVLNSAPYNPVMRGYVKAFMWGGPRDNLLCPAIDDEKRPWIIQRGSGVLNYVVGFWRGVTDSLRSYLASVDLPHDSLYDQGHLSVFHVIDPPEYVQQNMWRKNEFQPQRFLNHVICGALYSMQWRVIDGNAIGILRCDDVVTILSEDHEDQPIFLRNGWYVVMHPFPSRGRTVD
jgi:hypothetical protein